MSASTTRPSTVDTENGCSTPAGTGGGAASGEPSTNEADSCERSASRRPGEYGPGRISGAGSTSVTCVAGNAASISPANSRPTAPAPSSNTRAAPASETWAEAYRDSDSTLESWSALAGKG